MIIINDGLYHVNDGLYHVIFDINEFELSMRNFN